MSGERKTPVPDGWGSTETSAQTNSARSSKPRKRITLRIEGPALALPTDLPTDRAHGADSAAGSELERGSEHAESSSAELELPSGFEHSEPGAGSPTPEGSEGEQAPDGRDGWQVARSSGTIPPPPRPKSEPPSRRRATSESTESLRLVSAHSRPAPAHPPDLAADMNDRFALDDFSGALRAAELLLGQTPSDVEAAQVAATSRERLVQFYLARLGGLDSILGLKVEGAEVRWLGLDHRAGFLLSLVDGTTTVEEVVDLSGMPRHEALRLLAELLDGGAVERAR